MPERLPGPNLMFGPLDGVEASALERLVERAGIDGYRIATPKVGALRLGDPGALYLVAELTPIALAGIAAFLLKHRRQSAARYTLSIDFPDGTRVREELVVESTDSEAPRADVIGQLAKLAKVASEEIARHTVD